MIEMGMEHPSVEYGSSGLILYYSTKCILGFSRKKIETPPCWEYQWKFPGVRVKVAGYLGGVKIWGKNEDFQRG